MKKLEAYVDKIYSNFDAKDEETKILKEEVKAHLLEEIEDLKKQGLTEEESINKALVNFGSENLVIEQMNIILRKQNKFFNIIKKLALTLFIFSLIFFSIYIGDDLLNPNKNYINYNPNTSTYIEEKIINKLTNKTSIDTNLKNEIDNLLDKFNEENNNGLYYLEIENIKDPTIRYQYSKDVSEDMIKNGNGGLLGVNDWKIYSKTTDNQTNFDYTEQIESWNKRINRLPNRLGQIANCLFLISIVLFFVYFINKYYSKKLLRI